MKLSGVGAITTLMLGLACSDVQQVAVPTAVATTQDRLFEPGPPATIIYTNFGPGLTYPAEPRDGWGINGPWGPYPPVGHAQVFTSSEDFEFTRTRLVLTGGWRGIPAPLLISLQIDSSGKPGHVIESFHATIPDTLPRIYTFESVLHPLLEAGHRYWISVVTNVPGAFAGWQRNSVGDTSVLTFAQNESGTPEGPWQLLYSLTRSVFQVEGRSGPSGNGVVHQVSGSGTVLWSGSPVTYGINARQMRDGRVTGELLFHAHYDTVQFRGKVTCLNVVANRAYLTGELVQSPYGYPKFAIALEDNGEGGDASREDRVSGLLSMYDDWPDCLEMWLVTDWTRGNVQVR